MIYELSFLILLLPLLSFIVLGLAGMKMQHKTAGLIGTCSLSLVTILSYWTAFTYFTADRTAEGVFQTIVPFNFTWLPLGNLHFDMGILLDPISVMMLIVISTVSLMVHIYSFGYMHGEKGFQRYYAFLSRTGYQHLPDVHVLGIGGCLQLPAYRLLLSFEARHCCF